MTKFSTSEITWVQYRKWWNGFKIRKSDWNQERFDHISKNDFDGFMRVCNTLGIKIENLDETDPE